MARRDRGSGRRRSLLRRAGGDRCRSLRGTTPLRLDRLDASRARPLHRQGRRRSSDDGRALRQGDRHEPGQRRLDAHHGHSGRRARRQPDRRDGRDARGRGGSVGEGSWGRRGRGCLLRRGGREHRSGPRGDEPGGDLEAARRLRLREQRVRAGDTGRVRDFGRRTSPTVPPAYAMPGVVVDGQDVLEVYRAAVDRRGSSARQARARA